ALGIAHVVSTELEVDARGLFTGKHVPPLAYGAGKIARAQQLADRVGLSLDDAVFYSDSISDMPLFLRVKEQVAVNPDPRLRREAKKRGWRIEEW
ncbi:MAG: HAD family hydrolase, partial [Polyangiales bacterium]